MLKSTLLLSALLQLVIITIQVKSKNKIQENCHHPHHQHHHPHYKHHQHHHHHHHPHNHHHRPNHQPEAAETATGLDSLETRTEPRNQTTLNPGWYLDSIQQICQLDMDNFSEIQQQIFTCTLSWLIVKETWYNGAKQKVLERQAQLLSRSLAPFSCWLLSSAFSLPAAEGEPS